MGRMERNIPKALRKSVSGIVAILRRRVHYRQISATTSRFFRGCKHPGSFHVSAADRHLRRRHGNGRDSETSGSSGAGGDGRKDEAATLEDIDRFLYENFRSLYYDDEDETEEEESDSLSVASFDSSRRFFATPALTPRDLYSPHPMFVEDEGSRSKRSDAVVDSLSPVTGSTIDLKTGANMANGGLVKGKKTDLSEECIAVLKASTDMQGDFRQSMREVMVARERNGQAVDWEFMQELLFCYLRLNEKKQYRHVLSAFVDTAAEMRPEVGGDEAAGEVGLLRHSGELGSMRRRENFRNTP